MRTEHPTSTARNRISSILTTLRTDAGGAALLVVATTIALIWANLSLDYSYEDFWHTPLVIGFGDAELHLDLRHFVNDGLMTFFFLVVGLEVKHDLVLGELSDRRRLAVPLFAAAGGLIVPALIFAAINSDSGAASGWGVVISTDTAFLLGVLALLGRACPPQLRVLLMALAVVDDVGALVAIALFYTSDLQLGYLAAACGGLIVIFVLRWFKVWRGPAYMVVGIASWIALYLSGVHATLLGVVIALTTSTYATRRTEVVEAARSTKAYLQSPNPAYARSAGMALQRAVPVNARLLRLWQPWTTVVIVPLFALANAGIPLSLSDIGMALTSPIAIGVVAGLLLGKIIGIFGGAELAIRLGIGRATPGVTRLHLLGGSALAGMGFTISLFIVDLAFTDQDIANQARIGILIASALAAAVGSVILIQASRRYPADDVPVQLEPPVDVKRDHISGDPEAPLTLVEYGDYESVGARGAHLAVQEAQQHFGAQLRFAFRHFVDKDATPGAHLTAEAVEAAGAQGKFWQMHNHLLSKRPPSASSRSLIAVLLDEGEQVGLDATEFAGALGAGRFTPRIQHDFDSAIAGGATESPTFFINGTRYEGPNDGQSLINALLAARGDAGDSASDDGPRHLTGQELMTSWQYTPTIVDDFESVSWDMPETPDDGLLPSLSEEHLALLREHGSEETLDSGHVLFRAGDKGYDFFAITSGAVAVLEYSTYGAPAITAHEHGRFLGEVDLFTGQPRARTALVIRRGEIIRLSLSELRSVFEREPALREIVTRTFLLRRASLLAQAPDLRILGQPDSPEVSRLVEWANEKGLATNVDDIAADLGSYVCGALELAPVDMPVVLTRAGELLSKPTVDEIERALYPED